MDTLKQIYNKVGGFCDKGTTHSYIEIYEEILAPYRITTNNVLEIGIFDGSSLRMWERYFFDGDVFGIDCSETPHNGMVDLRPMIAEDTHNIFILNAANKEQVNRIFEDMFFDVIIDDASHQLEHQIQQFANFYPLLNKDGIYIIEDIQNIDQDRQHFMNLAFDVEILDRRKLKGRYDDVMCIIRK